MMRLLFVFCIMAGIMFSQVKPTITLRFEPEEVSWNSKTRIFRCLCRLIDTKTSLGDEPIVEYILNLKDATMTVDGETRGFDDINEAERVSRAFNSVMFQYAAVSIDWWNEGRGIRLGPDLKPLPGQPPPKDFTPTNDKGPRSQIAKR